MPCGKSDILKVVVLSACADAFLRRRSTRIGSFVFSQKNVFERDHPSIHKEESWVLEWDKRCAFNNGMSTVLIESEKLRSQLMSFHAPKLSLLSKLLKVADQFFKSMCDGFDNLLKR